MRKKANKVVLFFMVLLGILAVSTIVKAGDLELEELNYYVTIDEDGTANVTETWKIYIEDTNTLFKTFETQTDKIKDVEVYEIVENGVVKSFKNINQYQYHVDKDAYYGLMNDGKFEIAWGAHAKYTTNTYKIVYKIEDAITKYNDCSEFYWKFIGTDSEIPAQTVTGTIILPKVVSSIENLMVWAHGPLNGQIYK